MTITFNIGDVISATEHLDTDDNLVQYCDAYLLMMLKYFYPVRTISLLASSYMIDVQASCVRITEWQTHPFTLWGRFLLDFSPVSTRLSADDSLSPLSH